MVQYKIHLQKVRKFFFYHIYRKNYSIVWIISSHFKDLLLHNRITKTCFKFSYKKYRFFLAFMFHMNIDIQTILFVVSLDPSLYSAIMWINLEKVTKIQYVKHHSNDSSSEYKPIKPHWPKNAVINIYKKWSNNEIKQVYSHQQDITYTTSYHHYQFPKSHRSVSSNILMLRFSALGLSIKHYENFM